MREVVRDWDWWAYLYRVVHRETIPGISEWDERLVDFVVSELHLKPGADVLDVACGSGVHLFGLGLRGIGGVGVDIAPSLVAHAAARAREAGVDDRAVFTTGDMRALETAVGGRLFDAVTLLSGSFGFFDHATNLAVLEAMAARLRPGGCLLLDCVAPASAPPRRRRSWQALSDGVLLFDEWYDPDARARMAEHRYVDGEGTLNLAATPESIRLYDHAELREMIATAGLAHVAAYSGNELPPVPYVPTSPRLVVVARRPDP